MRAPLIVAAGGSMCRSIAPRKSAASGHAACSRCCLFRLASPMASPRLAEGRDHGFDGEKQCSAVFWIFDELGAL